MNKPKSTTHLAKPKQIKASTNIGIIIATAIIFLLLGLWSSSLLFNKNNKKINIISGTYLEKAIVLSDFKLISHEGKRVDLNYFKNQWTFVFFGYTHCPDICPQTLTTLKILAKQIQQLAANNSLYKNTRYLFVSVDPKRDTIEHLKKYVQFYHKNISAATGPHSELQKLTRQLGILYSVDKNQDNYVVDHSAHIVLINPHSQFQALFSHPQDPTKLLEDYKLIRNTNQ